MTVYQSEQQIREVVEKFETCAYAAEEFTHARHLTVACWYLSTLSRESALLHMREGLVRFTGHHGRQGYHETLTRFWLVLLEEFLGPLGEIETLVERTNHALEHYANKEIVFDYYSRERVLSQAARERWVEPDRMSLRQPSGQAP